MIVSKFIFKFIFQCMLCMLLAVVATHYASPAQAAIACVQNKTTGQYESLGSKKNCHTEDLMVVISNLETIPASNKSTVKTMESKSVSWATSSAHLPSSLQEWSVRKDDKTIRAVLERWGAAAGWNIAWEVPRKVPVAFDATFVGSFEVAVDKLMRSLRGSDYPLVNCQYEDNKVVRILRRGEIKKCEE